MSTLARAQASKKYNHAHAGTLLTKIWGLSYVICIIVMLMSMSRP